MDKKNIPDFVRAEAEKSSAASSPPVDGKRQTIINHLERTNVDMIGKMGTLIELTEKVTHRVKINN